MSLLSAMLLWHILVSSDNDSDDNQGTPWMFLLFLLLFL